MKFQLFYVSIIYFYVFTLCNTLEPISGACVIGGLLISVGFAGYKYLSCAHNECCDHNWISFNQNNFEEKLDRSLFGQHLAKSIVLKSLRAHLSEQEPIKALVLSFHGDTGTGKNHVSNMIRDNLYKNGVNSQYTYLYISTQHFPHKHLVHKYQDQLRKDIEKYTKRCERSLFIFDEMDKMPPGIFKALKPYLDFNAKVDGIDYRKNIFIFLSNADHRNITKVALDFWVESRHREEISLKDLEHLITRGDFNEEGGLKYSEIRKSELIDVYVPFLPLEKRHVRQCVQTELRSRGLKGDVDMITNELLYYPKKGELFSISGCKRVAGKVDIYAS